MKDKKFLRLLATLLVVMIAITTVFTVASFAEGEDTAITGAESNDGAGEETDKNKDEKTPGSNWKSIVLMIVVYGGLFALLYLVLIRPQKKKQKQEQEMRNSLILGDSITTIGGIVGRVVKIQDDEITIETSIDRSLLTFKNWAVRDIKHNEEEQ